MNQSDDDKKKSVIYIAPEWDFKNHPQERKEGSGAGRRMDRWSVKLKGLSTGVFEKTAYEGIFKRKFAAVITLDWCNLIFSKYQETKDDWEWRLAQTGYDYPHHKLLKNRINKCYLRQNRNVPGYTPGFSDEHPINNGNEELLYWYHVGINK